ncbi:hypothetical protein M8J77_008380 [Diaphorina citri]|nr:hypothetical protein M8J77_008380 [Diaphorina citri]
MDVPPERPEIFDFRNKDKQHRKIEPFNEGQELKLQCQVIGGRPQPKVVWFLESQLIEGRTEVYDNMVKNVITIDPVARHHLHSRLACNASNTNLITASIRQITLDVNFTIVLPHCSLGELWSFRIPRATQEPLF